MDFCWLNDVTKKNTYPLPRVEDNLDTLQGAKYYSTLDLLSVFGRSRWPPRIVTRLLSVWVVVEVSHHAIRTLQCSGNVPTTDGTYIERVAVGNSSLVYR